MLADNIDEQRLECAKKLVQALELGNREEIDHMTDQITNLKEVHLFQELGKLTRQFHEALNGFRCDERLASLAEEDMPDAKERLSYVITRTEDAANKTLNAVENAMPVCDSIVKVSMSLRNDWERFKQRELTAQEFRSLSKDVANFLSSTTTDVGNIRSDLNEVLMAQDFQDITGQIIRRVITLVDEVEQSLVNLIRLGSADSKNLGRNVSGETPNATFNPEESGVTILEGPQIPGMESESIVKSQDDVDDLLSSLGF